MFDELTSLQELWLTNNQLSKLPDGVFEELTLLDYVPLAGNPGVSFAPVAVALPDDGRVPTGDTVRLDGSGSGGPWART